MGSPPSVYLTSSPLAPAASKTSPSPFHVSGQFLPRGFPCYHPPSPQTPPPFLHFFSSCSCFILHKAFWVSNQLSEFPIGRLITSYWLICRTFLPLGNGTLLSLWLLCLHTFCYLMSTLANE